MARRLSRLRARSRLRRSICTRRYRSSRLRLRISSSPPILDAKRQTYGGTTKSMEAPQGRWRAATSAKREHMVAYSDKFFLYTLKAQTRLE